MTVVGRCGAALALAMCGLLFAAVGAQAQVLQKAPAATTEVSGEEKLAPGATRMFFVHCPKGYVLTDTAIHAVTSLGGSERADPKAAGLRVTRESLGLGSMQVDITNAGGETLLVFVSGRCVKRSVRVRVDGGAVDARLQDNRIVGGGAGEGGAAQRNDCGKAGQPIGHRLSELSAFSPISFLAYVVFYRRVMRSLFGPPPTQAGLVDEAFLEFAFRTFCTSRKARVAKPGAAGKPRSAVTAGGSGLRARVVVRRIARNRVIPPHADAEQTKRVSVRCPRRFTATSFGWNGRNPDLSQPPRVQLRRSLYPGRRRVAVEVTNSSGANRKVKLVAICLAVRIKR